MNIFKILSRGNGKVSETNVSAFLGFLLNPNEQHGLGKEFLSRFLEVIKSKIEEDNEVFSSIYVNDQISKELVQKFNIDIAIEKSYKDAGRIDIELSFEERKEYNPKVKFENKKFENNLTIGLELKINDEAIQKEQLQNYYNHLSKENGNKLLIFLALNSMKSNDIINKIKKNSSGPEVIFITWEDIQTVISDILDDHSKGNIDPIQQLSIQLLISLKQFIDSDFRDDVDPKEYRYKATFNKKNNVYHNNLNGIFLEICKYLSNNNSDIFKELIKIKNPSNENIASYNYFIVSEQKYNEILNPKDPNPRFFTKENQIIKFENERYYLTNQYVSDNLESFKNKLKKMGVEIKIKENKKKK